MFKHLQVPESYLSGENATLDFFHCIQNTGIDIYCMLPCSLYFKTLSQN